jgi:hypothetical protein
MEYFYSVLCIGLLLLLNLFYLELKSSYLKQATMVDKNKARLSVVLDFVQTVLLLIIYGVILTHYEVTFDNTLSYFTYLIGYITTVLTCSLVAYKRKNKDEFYTNEFPVFNIYGFIIFSSVYLDKTYVSLVIFGILLSLFLLYYKDYYKNTLGKFGNYYIACISLASIYIIGDANTNVCFTLGTLPLAPIIQLIVFGFVVYKAMQLEVEKERSIILGINHMFAVCLLSASISELVLPYTTYETSYLILAFPIVSTAFNYVFSTNPKIKDDKYKLLYLATYILNNLLAFDYLIDASNNYEFDLVGSILITLLVPVILYQIAKYTSSKYYWLLSALIFAEFLTYMNIFPILRENDLLYSVLAILLAVVMNYFGNTKENKYLLNSSIFYIVGFTLKIIVADIDIFNQENILIQVILLFALAFVFLYLGIYYRNKNIKKEEIPNAELTEASVIKEEVKVGDNDEA